MKVKFIRSLYLLLNREINSIIGKNRMAKHVRTCGEMSIGIIFNFSVCLFSIMRCWKLLRWYAGEIVCSPAKVANNSRAAQS
jgi:hypothetical protein